MTGSTRLRTAAWLLRGTRSVPGELALSGGTLRFTAHGRGNLSRSGLRGLERRVGRAGLAERLVAGERSVVFEAPLAEVRDVRFPWYYFSGGVKLTVGGVRYRLGFDQPSNTKLEGEGGDLPGEISRARERGASWKSALSGLHRSGRG